MPGRSRSRSRKPLPTLHEEEPLQPLIADSYELAVATYNTNAPLNDSLKEQIQSHMEESVIMSLGKHTPYTSNDITPAIREYLDGRDVKGDIVKSRYMSRIRSALRGGGKSRRRTRSARRKSQRRRV